MLAAGMALSAAGAGAQMAGAANSRSAMNAQVAAEAARQKGYQDQAGKVFDESLQQSTPLTARQQMGQGEDRANAEYKKLESLPMGTSTAPFQSGTSGQVLNAGRTQQSNQAQARLQGYTEWDLQQAIKNMSANRQLGVIGTNAHRSAGVSPYEIQQASHAGDTLSGIGSLLGLAGTTVGALGGLSGMGSAAGVGAGVNPNNIPITTIMANQPPPLLPIYSGI